MSIEAYWCVWGLIGIAVGIYGYIISRPSRSKSAPSGPGMTCDPGPKD